MPAENDGAMLEQLSYAFGDLQYKYRFLDPLEREDLRPELEEAFEKYKDYRLMLLGGPTLVTDEDLAQMRVIRAEIDAAASKQSLIEAAVRIAKFIIPRML